MCCKMDRQTQQALAAALFAIACGAIGGIIGKALKRKQFSIPNMLAIVALVAMAAAIHGALGW